MIKKIPKKKKDVAKKFNYIMNKNKKNFDLVLF